VGTHLTNTHTDFFRDVETSYFSPVLNEIKRTLFELITDFEENCRSSASVYIKNYFEKTVAFRVKAKFGDIKQELARFKNWDSNDFSEQVINEIFNLV
jgi:hypothetical protein